MERLFDEVKESLDNDLKSNFESIVNQNNIPYASCMDSSKSCYATFFASNQDIHTPKKKLNKFKLSHPTLKISYSLDRYPDFYEVKNTPEVHEQFVRDAGFQYYIITRSGLKIDRIFIVIHGPDEENPFVPVDVTEQAKGYYKWIHENIWDLNRMQKQADEVQIEPGEQCTAPYECWYYGYCHGCGGE